MDWADAIRVLILLLFGLSVGEAGWILRKYYQVAVDTRRLLATHVTAISASLLLLEFHVAYSVTRQFGDSLNWLLILDLLACVGVYASLILIKLHTRTKPKKKNQVKSLLEDPNETS